MSAEPAICNLKYFAGKANELALLRDRVAELEELLGISVNVSAQIGALGFTPGESAIVGILLKRKGCTQRGFIWTAMYGSSSECDQPDDKIIDVWLVKCRRKLKPMAVEIKNVWGQGWLISEQDKARLRTHMEAT